MKTILVPLDGSGLAQQALSHVAMLAPLLDAPVRVLCVVSDREPEALRADTLAAMDDADSPSSSLRWDEAMRREADAYLAEQAARLRATGLQINGEVRTGRPAQAIVDAAMDDDVALAVMATHGYGGMRRWALGSVTNSVVHAIRKPVYVVRTCEQPADARPAVQRILVPLDGSILARQALPAAVDLATRTHAELLLLTVVAPPLGEMPWNMQPRESEDGTMAALCEQLLTETRDVADQLAAAQIRVTPIAMTGFPAEAIIHEAERRDADLIVMATHGYSGVRRWALGSVADKVLQATPVPLLLVRAAPEPARFSREGFSGATRRIR